MTAQSLKSLAYSIPTLLLILISSCAQKEKKSATFNGELFSVSFQGCSVSYPRDNDEYSGIFIVNDIDTFHYSIGFVVDNLSEPLKQVVYTRDSTELSGSNVDVLYTLDKYYDVDNLRKQNINYAYSNGHYYKIVYPIDSIEGGLIGVYVDSLIKVPEGKLKLNVFTPHLNATSYGTVMKAFQNIQIYKWETLNLEVPYGTLYVR